MVQTDDSPKEETVLTFVIPVEQSFDVRNVLFKFKMKYVQKVEILEQDVDGIDSPVSAAGMCFSIDLLRAFTTDITTETEKNEFMTHIAIIQHNLMILNGANVEWEYGNLPRNVFSQACDRWYAFAYKQTNPSSPPSTPLFVETPTELDSQRAYTDSVPLLPHTLNGRLTSALSLSTVMGALMGIYETYTKLKEKNILQTIPQIQFPWFPNSHSHTIPTNCPRTATRIVLRRLL